MHTPGARIRRTPPKRNARRGARVAVTLLLILGALAMERATRITPYVRDQAVSALNAKFARQAARRSLQVSIFPKRAVLGQEVVVRYNGNPSFGVDVRRALLAG